MPMTYALDGEIFEMTAEEEAAFLASLPVISTVPETVSRAQAKIALSRNNLLASVEQAVSAAGGEVAIWYADALNWRRDNDHVVSLGASLGLTSDQIDDLFRQAAQIDG